MHILLDATLGALDTLLVLFHEVLELLDARFVAVIPVHETSGVSPNAAECVRTCSSEDSPVLRA